MLKTPDANGAAGPVGLVAADAEAMPFADNSFDVVMCIRFLFHVPPEKRVVMLREMARMARRYIILDYRMRFSLRNLRQRVFSALRLAKPLKGKVTRKQMRRELADAGLEPIAAFPVARIFSDKLIVLCRPM
jgi:ubiquinone/menaquinone biosynthesis C-methylase UbiE